MNAKNIIDLPEELLSKISTYIKDITTYDAYRVSCKKIRQSLIGEHYNGIHFETISSIGSNISGFREISYNIYAEPKGRTRTIASDNGDSLVNEFVINRGEFIDTLTVDISRRPYLRHMELIHHNIYEIKLVRNLHTLNLHGCTLVTKLPDLGRLKVLNISSSNITDVSMCGNLYELQAESTDISDVSMLGNLHTLNIARTKVTDVSALGNLHTLNISATRVTNVSMLGELKFLYTCWIRDLDVSMLTNVQVYI
jgi:hypothetical protein